MHLRRILLALSAPILAAFLLVACGDDDDASDSSAVELPDGAAEVVDDYYQTVAVDHDGEGMLELVTDSFEFVAEEGSMDSAQWAAQVDTFFDSFTVERIGEMGVAGADDEYLISQPELLKGTSLDEPAMTVMRVVEVDGAWLIDMHQNLTTG